MNINDADILKTSHKIILEIAEKIKPTIENPLEISSQELALNLNILLSGKGFLHAQDAESYRELILGLNEKLKILQITLERIHMISTINADLLKEKECRESSQQKALNELERIRKIQDEKEAELKNENKKVLVELNEAKKQLQNSQKSEDQLRFEIEKIRAELESKKLFSDRSFDKISSNADSNDFEKLKSALSESLKNYDLLSENSEKQYENLLKENENLVNQINSAKENIKFLKSENNKYESNKALLESLIKSKENDLKAYKELESNYESLQNYSENLKSQNAIYTESLKSLTEDNRKLSSELNSTKDNTNIAIQSLNNKILQQESQLQSKSKKIKDIENELSELLIQSSLANKKISATSSALKTTTEDLSRLQKEFFENQKKTESEIEFIANYSLKSSQDHLEQQRNLKKLSEIVSEKDSEVTILREMIAELQKVEPSYFPVKGDIVDQALGEYINSRPEPLEINFIREDQGTYLFGSKRVFIKIENGKIISNCYSVRVGGGFMRIDEFVEAYTPLEVEKLDERKKFENSPSRRSSLGKIGNMRKGYLVSDKSKQDLSTQKAAKIIQDSFMSGKTKFATCIAVPRKLNNGDPTPVKKSARKNSITEKMN